MKRILYIFLFLLALTACKEQYVARITDLRLVSVEPRNGYPGDLVTLIGWNFSPIQEQNEVLVDNAPAIVLEASSSRLQIVLPEHRPLEINYLKRPDHEYMASTIVGQQGQRKCVDGVGTEALTYMPTGINKAPDGTLWFTDRGGNKLRRIAADLTVTTLMDAQIPGAALWQGCFDGEGNYWCNDKANGTTKLSCKYDNFKPLGTKQYPHLLTLNAQSQISKKARNITVTIKMDGAKMSSDWETRTTLSSKYKEVSADEVLEKIMNM